ncbi:penicillin-binding transpeptidase domain-containing protein [Rufibacter roseus]|uniref:Beta-lactamase n=1 Tax=Rufibacter roseus TaxID=1567108 RepID=A0ABW2DKJ5_9BACT|nr:penicillin-binding transpeptidase domain-containing protein [Rufibacter roseus]
MKQLLSFSLLLYFFVSHAIKAQDLQQPFRDCGLQGSFTLYDLKNNRWTYSDAADSKRASLPASTFKILNSLIALEEQTVANEHEVLRWDGQKHDIAAWNADTDMAQAFKNSTVWFYVRLAEKIGKDQYRAYLKRSGYGNGKLNKSLGADFWNYGDFAVSPKEQIEFLRKFHAEQLPFSKENIRKVKKMMVEEQIPEYTLRAKTGWTIYGGTDSGWWVGYVETKDNVYFFATRVHKERSTQNENFASYRKTITRNLLQQLGVLPLL